MLSILSLLSDRHSGSMPRKRSRAKNAQSIYGDRHDKFKKAATAVLVELDDREDPAYVKSSEEDDVTSDSEDDKLFDEDDTSFDPKVWGGDTLTFLMAAATKKHSEKHEVQPTKKRGRAADGTSKSTEFRRKAAAKKAAAYQVGC